MANQRIISNLRFWIKGKNANDVTSKSVRLGPARLLEAVGSVSFLVSRADKQRNKSRHVSGANCTATFGEKFSAVRKLLPIGTAFQCFE